MKPIALLATTCLLLTLAGCRQTSEPTENSSTSTSTETVASTTEETESTQESTASSTKETTEPKEEVTGEVYQGQYELPVQGATGYASINLPLRDAANFQGAELRRLEPGTGFTIIKEENGWLNVKIDGQTGWLDSHYCFVNLPDLIPSIKYNITNNSKSLFVSSGQAIPNVTDQALYESRDMNDRLNKEEYIVPVLYNMAGKIMNAQKAALAEGNTLVIYEAFRPLPVQLNVANQLLQLAQTSPEVMAGIASSPWQIDWFISTKVSNHQVGYAIDVTVAKIDSSKQTKVGKYLVTDIENYTEYPMHTAMHELSAQSAIYTHPVNTNSPTAWQSAAVNPNNSGNVALLQNYLITNGGLTPLASEWWHFNDLDALNGLHNLGGNGDYVLHSTYSEIPE
ncbi:SH3 domain-containing protein [Enterococcus sp. 669A]|uniref:SH3 domain-containing protein n=1 Tax=Candidatus Enterococcus moelleringii TaxID=2815325 RepID=A0ABS3LCH0_9ENTE|nr:M15 family metallopeptidase [Enterococcus sp. 669A]MBO1307330.1 SH3 domain-containing protein [Enterococcus sp. 669A]